MPHVKPISQGVAQAYTGLGILLGCGLISKSKHAAIMDLMAAEIEYNVTARNVAADVTADVVAEEPEDGDDNPEESATQSQDFVVTEGQRYYRTGFVIADAARGRPVPPPSLDITKVICPFWSTPGYRCKDPDSCPRLHEDVDTAVKQPPICWVWAHGGRCGRSLYGCRLAHHPTIHRMVAPRPNSLESQEHDRPTSSRSSVSDVVSIGPSEAEIFADPFQELLSSLRAHGAIK
ncbi:hypothetical protein GGR52DRAFT_569638 [Hypoxylon sp. FL1284]|nr:hypothetical protein GGR52DRAFT_569638 [Hypoxylon sp. FL1284]